jgi:crotonobetainyl-CoA:carnitine CoA-transferase CaiB-like acyl-CoA transferase
MGGSGGFDSIVQSTTGIVDASSLASSRSEPTPLPVQALDYCTGLLAAFAGTQPRPSPR